MALTNFRCVNNAALAKWQRKRKVLCALLAVQAFTTGYKVNRRATRVLQDATSPGKEDATSPGKQDEHVILAPLKPLV